AILRFDIENVGHPFDIVGQRSTRDHNALRKASRPRSEDYISEMMPAAALHKLCGLIDVGRVQNDRFRRRLSERRGEFPLAKNDVRLKQPCDALKLCDRR